MNNKIFLVRECDVPNVAKRNDDDLRSEDGDQAMILNIYEQTDTDAHDTITVILSSWDFTTRHKKMKKILGKKIRITVEII